MENFRFIKIVFIGTIFIAPIFAFAYSDETTHPALTDEIVDLFNIYYPKLKFSEEEKELVKKGSIEEDGGVRYLWHFYDPVYNRGLGGQISSKEWAENTVAQAFGLRPLAGAITGLFGAPTDYSWERAIYDYVWNDKDRGLEALGHVLHLIEDASVPDHTRNDPHPPILDFGSPYESWTKKFTPKNIEGLTSSIYRTSARPLIFSSLSEYFDSLATYSNNNFFSKDTIFHQDYNTPVFDFEKREILSDGNLYIFKYKTDEMGNYRLVASSAQSDWYEVTQEGGLSFFIDDNDDLILTDYWSRLSKQAVLHGLGVVRLFFEEAEKERQSRILLSKSKSLLDKTVAAVLNSWGLGINERPKIAEIPQGAFEPVISTSDVDTEKFASESATSDVAQAAPENLGVELPSEPPKPQSEANVQPLTFNTLIPIPPGGGGGGAPAPKKEEESSPAPPADITGPLVLLSISECQSSLSPAGCLLATTTINLAWSSGDSDLDHYMVECDLGGISCEGFDFASTTATSTTYAVPTDDSIYTFKAKAVDKSGNQGSQVIKTAEISTRPVVINEIAWAGTATSSFDEWIELYNRTSKTVSLSGWVLAAEDGVPYINISGNIAAAGYYLIERSNNNTVSDVTADLVAPFSGTAPGSGLSNFGEVLVLSRASTTVDQSPPLCGFNQWCAGSATGFLTMERVDPDVSGTVSTNWGSPNGTVKNGKDAAGASLAGTARARNSLNYLITTGTNLTANTTLKKSKSPFIIKAGLKVNAGATLTIEPGVVIKFFENESYLVAPGVIKALGTAAEKIVFTSFKDDEFGGDLNADATSTSPAAQDWRTIDIQGPGSEFDHTIIRYGGKWFSGIIFGRANLKVANTSLTLKNSSVEEGGIYGVWLDSVSGTVEGNTIKNNKGLGAPTPPAGLYLTGGSATISGNTFDANKVGLRIEPDTLNAANTSSVMNNTFTSNQNEAIRVISSFPTFSSNTATSSGTNGIVITGNQSFDYTFVAGLPYIVDATYTVNSGKTLTINPGAVVKFKDNLASISVGGKILANGTVSSKIVFTSLADDSQGGDTNNNSTTTSPQAGDWRSVEFSASSATSTLDNVLIRYGGGFFAAAGAVSVSGSSPEIKNSVFEFNNFNALWLSGSGTTTVSNTVFRSNQTAIRVDAPASFISGGGISFEANTTNTIPAGLIP